jgi:hypothetical protein
MGDDGNAASGCLDFTESKRPPLGQRRGDAVGLALVGEPGAGRAQRVQLGDLVRGKLHGQRAEVLQQVAQPLPTSCSLWPKPVAVLFTEPSFGMPFVGLLAESQHDPALAEALHDWLIHSRRAGAAEVLRRGIARGEPRADLDVAVAVDTLYGALYYRLLVSHQPLSAGYARSVLDLVLTGLEVGGE